MMKALTQAWKVAYTAKTGLYVPTKQGGKQAKTWKKLN